MVEQPEKKKANGNHPTGSMVRHWSGQAVRAAEKRLPSWAQGVKEPGWQRWTLVVVTSLVAAFIMAPKSARFEDLTLGVPARETIISPITFKVVDEEATGKNRDEVLASLRPVYDLDDEMVHDVQARIVSACDFMKDYLRGEADYLSKEMEQLGAAPDAKDKKPDNVKAFRPLDPNALRTRFENMLGARVTPTNFELLKSIGFDGRIQRDVRSLVVPVLVRGVVQSRELVMRDGKDGILLRIKSKDKLEPLKDLSKIYDLKEAVRFINHRDNDPAPDTAYSHAVRRLATDLVNVNIQYNRDETARLKEKALASVKPVYFQVAKGEPIIREGEPVNKGHQIKLAGLNSANPPYSRQVILAGLALLLVLMLKICFYFSEKYLQRSRYATEDLLLFCVMLLGTIAMVKFIASLSPMVVSLSRGMDSRSIMFLAPVATSAMLASLMVDPRIAFIFGALIAFTSTLAVEGDVYLFAFYFLSGIVGLHGMTRATDRKSILKSGLLVGLVNMASVLAIQMAMGNMDAVENLHEMGLGFAGGVLSSLLVMGLSPLLEPLGYITNARLLELASLNHPLIREMAIAAPGTYHHSMMVGNLAESAAELIGANPLLARVGALYHDIGKIGKATKPYYFIENQEGRDNPHDKLEPSMSSLILLSHVKNGVEKAREHKLASPLVDIIQQHHGTNLIQYFYTKAIEKAEKSFQKVSEDKYRYPGPRPQTKEAALVMLADVAEAASRTLTDPTPAKIQKRVQSLIIGMFSEGQLDQSTLTLKDIHAITRSFVRSLQGILHARIDYPTNGHSREKTNGDLSRHQTDKGRGKPGRAPEENGVHIRRLGL